MIGVAIFLPFGVIAATVMIVWLALRRRSQTDLT